MKHYIAKPGNPGYGKQELIRSNMDKFSPVFWELIEEFTYLEIQE